MVNINLNGITRLCNNSIGGIRRVGICDYNEGHVKDYTRVSAQSQLIYSKYMETIPDLGVRTYETLPSGSTYSISSNKGGNNILNYKVTITLNFSGLSDAQYNELRNLLQYNVGFTVFAEMNTGEIICFGYHNPVMVSTFSVNSGNDVTSNVTNNLQLEVSEPELPRKVSMDWPK